MAMMTDGVGTGYDVLLWIEEAVALGGFMAPKISIHSSNSSAREKMVIAIKHIALLANSIRGSTVNHK